MGQLQVTGSQVEVPFPVPPDKGGMRLDVYLASRLHRYSRAQVQRLIQEGRVFLHGYPGKASARVAGGDLVLIRYPRREDPPSRHESLPILHEDEHLLAVDKPADVLSHPTDKVVKNTVTAILARQFPGLKFHLAHRLDRETSGALLLAKTREAARALAGQFYRGEVRKEYLAVVRGRAAFARKRVDLPLGRENGEIKVRQAAGQGEAAVTEVEALAVGEDASFVRALPRTGRLHQVRVHLAALGHPVLGDKLYLDGGRCYLKACRHELTDSDLAFLGAPRQMLHARRLSLAHPADGGRLQIAAPLPQDFLSRIAYFSQ